jgi:hypothetical protein
MKKPFLRSSVLVTLVAACPLTSMGGVPAMIDSESDAKAALVVPIHFATTVQNNLFFLTGGAQRVADLALDTMSAATTFEELTASGTGLEIACPYAGKLLARVVAPATIDITLTGCARLSGLVRDFTGEARIVLLSNSLSPNTVALIRLGTATEDLREKFYFEDSPGSSSLISHNISISGRIPVERAETDFGYYGPFNYDVTGFSEQMSITHAPDGSDGRFGLRYTAENLAVSGRHDEWSAGDRSFINFDIDYTSGTLGQTFVDTLSGVIDTGTVTFDAVRVASRFASQGNDNVTSLRVNGKADIAWSAGHGAGCVAGEYDIRTPQPLLFINDPGNYTAADGVLRLNDDYVARFSENPRTTIRVNVQHVGNFRYHDSITAVATSVPCIW